jgi:hypothetical protein
VKTARGLSIVLCLAVASATASAQTAQPPPQSRVKATLVFLTGAATGLAVHESGHVAFGVAFGAHPTIRRIDYGPIRFFAIHHDGVTRRKEFVISSAGFWMQSGGSEWLLSERPHLKDEHAPFLKGVLAFNVGASLLYSVAAFGSFGPEERDTRGMAVSMGKDGVPEPVVGVLVLAPAALDSYRYRHPDARWPIWTSRAVKIASVVLTMATGR